MNQLERFAARNGRWSGKFSCMLLAAALAVAPAAAREHSAQPTKKTVRQEEPAAPATPSIEYVQVKMGKSIFLDPPEDEEPGVYIRIRDTSGHEFQLQNRVIALLAENGFKRARSLKTAQYVLQANLLFAEEVTEAQLQQINDSDYDQGLGDILAGAVVGGAVGGAADSVIGDNSGLGAGSLIGGILGIAVAAQEAENKRQELEEKKKTKFFSVVVDLEVRQKTKGRVTRRGRSNLSLENEADSSQGSLTGNDSFSQSNESSTEEVEEYKIRSKWVRFRARMVASAKGRHVRLDDVKPEMTRKLSSAIGGMF